MAGLAFISRARQVAGLAPFFTVPVVASSISACAVRPYSMAMTTAREAQSGCRLGMETRLGRLPNRAMPMSDNPSSLTADPDKIIAAINRGHQVLDSIH